MSRNMGFSFFRYVVILSTCSHIVAKVSMVPSSQRVSYSIDSLMIAETLSKR
jgi:hypothetical protein